MCVEGVAGIEGVRVMVIPDSIVDIMYRIGEMGSGDEVRYLGCILVTILGSQ